MWIKICGNTNLEDAQHAVRAGANALGFIFAPSPRRITVEQARAITRELPPHVERYGVFVAASFNEIVTAIENAGLTGVQLHTGAAPDLPLRLREHFAGHSDRRLGILVALHYGAGLDQQLNALTSDHAVDAVLVDSRTATTVGGTGLAYDWKAAQGSFFRAAPHLRLIAAGGLRPENVAQAIDTLRPWGVDVVTGVEATPGRKDPARVEAFIRSAREAFAKNTQARAATRTSA